MPMVPNTLANTPFGQLADWVREARQRTTDLVSDLDDLAMLGPRLAIVNPPLWEIGHVAWFQEKWALRHTSKQHPIRTDSDRLYDSAAIPHETRWTLALPSRQETLAYLSEVRDRVLERLERQEPSPAELYFILLAVFHEDMHTEAFTYTRQTLGYPAPRFSACTVEERENERVREWQGGSVRALVGGSAPISVPTLSPSHPLTLSPSHPLTLSPSHSLTLSPSHSLTLSSSHSLTLSPSHSLTLSPPPPLPSETGPWPGDVSIPGGTFYLGATSEEPFVFDNEKWAHAIEIKPFAIARAPVTQGEFANFVEAGGYRRQQFWTSKGWQWRQASGAEAPIYWRPVPGGGWQRRDFDRWVMLEPCQPVVHVNWYEADAYCRWAGRRLPTEIEWEVAAAGQLDPATSRLSPQKRRFPWGDHSPTPAQANLDWLALGCRDVAAFPAGDSAFGCRQMIGNVWEWTSSDFVPYPGFVADPYQEYSAPWFGTHKVLRGGCWATRGRLLRNTWRNFYTPDRRDVGAGFRTCLVTADK